PPSTCGCRWRSGPAPASPVSRFSGPVSSATPLAAEAEEQVAVAVRAGDRLGHGAERRIDLAVMLEAVGQDLHLQHLALVLAGQDGARRGEAVVRLEPEDAGGRR